jgi:hypothetical protein
MTASIEKDSADLDLEAFVDLFDTAMMSDNPAVKKAFKNLLMIAAIVHEGQNLQQGPLRKLVEDIKNLNRRVSDLEGQKIYPGGGYGPTPIPMPSMPATPWPSGPTWISPTTGTPPWPPGTITCSVSTTGTDLLNKLEAK